MIVNVGTVGHVDYGKSTLTAALMRAVANSPAMGNTCISDQYRASGEMGVAYCLDRRTRKANKKARMAAAQLNAFFSAKSQGVTA